MKPSGKTGKTGKTDAAKMQQQTLFHA